MRVTLARGNINRLPSGQAPSERPESEQVSLSSVAEPVQRQSASIQRTMNSSLARRVGSPF